ncbi:hypothetical protein GQ44DRAFT_823457 [Phaeosphaeriaceae sp. PMI808]|nr:hypothetical protein GQ44DRAFT_823457 [Phaeosphaeriaceae sp. PMI808]
MAGIIIGLTVGGICCLLLFVSLAICLRRRKNRNYVSPNLPKITRKSDIGPPIMELCSNIDDIDQHEDLENGKEDHNISVECRHERPARLDLVLFADRRYSDSLTDSIDNVGTRILDNFDESLFGYPNGIVPLNHPSNSMKIPTELDTFREHRRRTTTVYHGQIHRSSGLPVRRRITGMGHGHHTFSPSRSSINFSRASLYRALSKSSNNTTKCTSIPSTIPSGSLHLSVARRQMFKDADFSDSVYTDEQGDIKEAKYRATVKPNQFTLPPLNLDTRRRSDPTPHYLARHNEHEGKENESLIYSFGTKPTVVKAAAQGKTKATASQERPKSAAQHSRTTSDTRKRYRKSSNSNKRSSKNPSNDEPTKERHSRKSIHSRTVPSIRSHHKKTREHSRTQSTPYPYFDINSTEQRPFTTGSATTPIAAGSISPSQTLNHH